jgi:hypothetical protein
MNLLSRETSPYLLQHSDNPVDWFPWSEEAIEKAKQESNQQDYQNVGVSRGWFLYSVDSSTLTEIILSPGSIEFTTPISEVLPKTVCTPSRWACGEWHIKN